MEVVESVHAAGGGDDGFAHGHGFHDFDIGSGAGEQGCDDDGGAAVGGAGVGDEGFEFDAGLLERRVDAVAVAFEEELGLFAGNDVEGVTGEEGPGFAEEPVEGHDVGEVGEGADEEEAAGFGLVL